MRRAVAAVALAALVALAGCSTFGLGGSPTPEDGEATPAGPLPPGVEDDGDVNETRLAQATFAAMNGTAVRVRHSNGPNRTVVYRNGRERYVRDEYGATWSRGNASVSNGSLLGDGYRSTYDEGVIGGSDDSGGVVFALGIRFATSIYEWSGTKTVDGTRLHVLEMTGTKGLGKALGHYTGRLLVDERGRVHLLDGEVGENASAANEYRFAFDWGVDAVPNPDWVDAVPRLSGDRVADGRALQLRVTGGEAIPAGTELRVSYDGRSWTLTLDEPLAPGESLYLGLRERDGERTLVAARQPLDDDLVNVSTGQLSVSGTAEMDDGRAVSLRVVVGQIDI